MDVINRRLLDQLQRSFPLVADPYRALGEQLDVSENQVKARIRQLKTDRLLRQISAIFNTGALGYTSSLVAMAVPEKALERAAEEVNRYPGVSHNYLRPGRFNMWFTIAVPPGEKLTEVVQDLARAAGGWPIIVLPALRKYKLAVVLDMLDDSDLGEDDGDADSPAVEAVVPFELRPEHIRIVRCIQEDLPLVSRPFRQLAAGLGMVEEELLAIIDDWLKAGVIRRFAAVLNHRQVGFSANGMVVWRSPLEQIDRLGAILGARAEVSHCYYRPAHPQWPYNLYAMVHGRSKEECLRIAARLAEAIELPDYDILFSTREFKKIRLKLFWDRPSPCGA